MSLLVIVPTRGRRAQCERMLKSFTETADFADIVFVVDPDDAGTYEGVEWGPAMTAVLDPRASTIEKLNKTAEACLDAYDAILFSSDDTVYRTPHWDTIMMNVLMEDLGGHGWVYPEDHRRNDIPEHYLVDTDLIRTLGWYANPACKHFYMADSVALLGRKTGMLRFCPQVLIEHLRYDTAPGVEHDETYKYAERTWGERDLRAFMEWQQNVMANEVAVLRRKYSPDVAWVLGRVA